MNDRVSVTCMNPQQAHQVIKNNIWPWVKANTFSGNRIVVEAKRETRSLAENRLLHALLGFISEQVEWAGKHRDSETWKRLLTAAWLRTRGEPIEMLPAIDGNGIDIVFRKTSQLTRAECAELIEYIFAWATEHDVRIPANVSE